MEFQKLGEKERKILLEAINFNTSALECQYCKENLDYKSCSIMPPVKTRLLSTLLCGSPLCYAEYFSDLDEDKEKKRNQEALNKLVDIYDNKGEEKAMEFFVKLLKGDQR